MLKEQTADRSEETKGKVNKWADKVAGDKSRDQAGATQKPAAKSKADASDDKKSAKVPSAPKPQDAMALLRADHKVVSELFDEYANTKVKSKKKSLVAQICADLTIHAQVEEEIFYPAVKSALKDKELVPEAIVEHAMVKSLIAQVEGVEPDGENFDAKVHVLSECVKHHVKEEEKEMFPKAKDTKLDMMELGAQIAARKTELLAERKAS